MYVCSSLVYVYIMFQVFLVQETITYQAQIPAEFLLDFVSNHSLNSVVIVMEPNSGKIH